jgi:hypothetical protein
VPGGHRQDHVEPLGRQRPVLEHGRDDLDRGEAGEVAPGDRRHVGTKLDRDDPAAPLGERHGRLPGPAADLQEPAAGLDTGQPRQVVEQRGRIARPRTIVELGGIVERLAQARTVVPGHARSVPANRDRSARGGGATGEPGR